MSHPQPASTASIPSLDGVRALAVGLVFLAHSGLEHLVPGGLGVTVFFVLSGFLITTLMRIEQARTGRLDLGAFYLRRALRLMPPLLLVAIAAALLARAGIIAGEFSAGGLASTLLYLGNYWVIANDYAGLPAGVGVVWSLAVEEHFYLFYPPLAAALLLKAAPARAAALLLGLSIAVLAWRGWLHLQGVSEQYIGMATDTRIDAILAGCVLAFACNPWLDPPRRRRPATEALLACACLALLAFTLLYREPAFRSTLRYSLQALAIAPLLYLAVARASERPFRWLSAPPLAWLGAVSYTVYLVHHVVLLGLEQHWPELGWAARGACGLAVTLLIAEAMRRAVERPCAELRRRLHRDAAPAAQGSVAARETTGASA